LARTIESLLDQTSPARAIACVDDASTDDSRSVIASFAPRGVLLVTNERTLGLAGNWNRAIAEVQTPYFVLAHQDDVYEHRYLSTMLDLIERHPRAFMAHCKTVSINERGDLFDSPAARYKEILWPSADPYEHAIAEELPRLAHGNFIICPSVMFRTSAVREIGPFDAQLEFVTDWEYWIRGLRAGYTIVGTHARLMSFRRHPATTTKSLERSFKRYREEAAMQEKIREAANATRISLKSEEGPVAKIILSEFASLLQAGERARAAELLAFADTEVPGFRKSMASRTMKTTMPLGRIGGRILKRMEAWFLSFALRGSRR
jgi:GT2 family glycosyltransferase